MMKSTTLRVDLMKVPFIAAVQGVTVCYIRSDVPPGIKKPTDIAKAERFRAGGLSFDSNKDLRFRLAFDILGVKYDYVTGYNSSNDARLAVQRNEIQYHDENIPGLSRRGRAANGQNRHGHAALLSRRHPARWNHGRRVRIIRS